MNDLELGYVAGIIDGEGCIVISATSSTNNRIMLTVKSTDLDILEKCRSYTGVGVIFGPYEKKNRKTWWCWEVVNKRDLRDLLSAISPLVCIRRQEKMELAIKELDYKIDIPKVCLKCQGDYLATFHRQEFCSVPCRRSYRYFQKKGSRIMSNRNTLANKAIRRAEREDRKGRFAKKQALNARMRYLAIAPPDTFEELEEEVKRITDEANEEE